MGSADARFALLGLGLVVCWLRRTVDILPTQDQILARSQVPGIRDWCPGEPSQLSTVSIIQLRAEYISHCCMLENSVPGVGGSVFLVMKILKKHFHAVPRQL